MAGGGDELKLLGMWASPFALRVKLALGFKGLSYQYVEENLRNKSDLLLKSNPVHKKVPVLIHNGKPVCESQIIVQYLDEVYSATGPSFLPVDPYERATARFWAAFIDDKFLVSWLKAGRGKTEEEKAEGVKETFAAVETLEGAFKECSKGKPFFGGDSVGYLDIVLGALVAWMRTAEVRHGIRLFDAFRSPLLEKWVERFGKLEEVVAVMPDIDRLVEHAKVREAEVAAAAVNNLKTTVLKMAGGSDELKLLGMWASPFVMRVKLALGFKGLSYEDVEEDLFGGKSELLLKSNPVHKKVPVLLHNGKPVCESQIIVQYIDEAFAGTGPLLLPSDPYERAIARFWGAYIDDKLLASFLQSAKGKTEEEKAEGLKQTLVAVENMEGAFKEISKGKPFFGGDTVGYLDVTLGALVSWIHAAEKIYGMRLFDATRSPLLNAWLEQFGALDVAKAALADVDRLVEYAKKRQADQAAAEASSNN
ncbi:uncharacterized protein LOC101763376 [Setaria italica]|nr:uncharacterized protein LOC101763376 [Setaria italica]